MLSLGYYPCRQRRIASRNLTRLPEGGRRIITPGPALQPVRFADYLRVFVLVRGRQLASLQRSAQYRREKQHEIVTR